MNILSESEIYACSLHEFLPVEKDRFFMLYAPLSTIATIVTSQDLDKIKEYLRGGDKEESIEEVVAALLDKSPSEESLAKRIYAPSDFVNISFLLNNICNFNCSYCYSASGRSSSELQEDKLIAALDYFISKERTNLSRLTLSFLGGGEPMISKHLIEKAVTHSNRLAQEGGFKLWFKIVTNGSLIKESDVDFLKENKIEVTVSYEILEEIQNLQRKHYTKVTENIKLLVDRGILLSLNSVITPNNVHRQAEMVNEVIRLFPEIDYLSFEPLMELNEWATGSVDSHFYDDFTTHFLEAREIAQENGIELSCSLLRNVDCVVERYCAGEFAVCPDGSITACPCISSPEMANYESYLYGQITEEGEVILNEEILSRLLSEDVHHYLACKQCLVKWNCGGGCINTNRQESKKQKADRCRFVRNFTKRILWERLKDDYEGEYGKTILEILNEVR